MQKKVYITLHDDIDQTSFVNGLPQDKVSLKNPLDNIKSVIILNVEEDYIGILEEDTRVKSLSYDIPPCFPASLPNFFTQSGTIRTGNPTPPFDGRDSMPMQFALSTDLLNPLFTVGVRDSIYDLANAFYRSRYTGKNVDIVTLEAPSTFFDNSKNNHPDFLHPDTNTSRIIPMDWPELEDNFNQQISYGYTTHVHGAGVLSVAGGRYCGFAKHANLRQMNITLEDLQPECINALISWHNSKAINPSTGLRNPTIAIHEYQYLRDRTIGIPIENISAITDLSTTVSRPVGGWGTDFTPFTSRNIIPFRILDPETEEWIWCCVFPYQGPLWNELKVAIEAAWDAGIIHIVAAGNNAGVYCKTTDPRYTGVFCSADIGATKYDIGASSGGSIISKTQNYSTGYYPFFAWGPHGSEKAIDVAAAQNSQDNPILDTYTNRGPGIDISGLGARTWSAYQYGQNIDINLWDWGFFDGTSCAAPTVAGIAACILEEYYEKFNQYPSPNQLKNIMLSNAKSVVQGVDGTTWSNRAAPDTDYQVSAISNYTGKRNLHQIQINFSPNGQYRFTELAGTTTKRVFFNSQSFNRSNTEGRRPRNKAVYPRPKIRKK